jgi:hypothetical protein
MNIDPTALGRALGQAVKALLDPLRARVKELEALQVHLVALKALEGRVAALEKSLEQRSYKGVYDGAVTYQRHNIVTKNGCMWVALKDTYGVPGESPDWQLAVKKGRNGRDVRDL